MGERLHAVLFRGVASISLHFNAVGCPFEILNSKLCKGVKIHPL